MQKLLLLSFLLSQSVILAEVSYGYSERIVVRNDALNGSCGDGDGSEITVGNGGIQVEGQPACDGNYGWAQCEGYHKFVRAKKGEIEWRKVKWEDYCREKHKNDPDDWKSGWRRSRLYRGCLTSFQVMAHQPTYRCYDFKEDPVYLANQEFLAIAKAAEYQAFKDSYQNSMEIFLNELNPYRKKLEEERRTLEAKQYEINRQIEQQKEIKKGVLKKIELFKKDYPEFKSNIKKMLTRLDGSISDRYRKIKPFYEGTRKLLGVDVYGLGEEQLNGYIKNVRNQLDSSSGRCVSSRDREIAKIRSQYKTIESYIDSSDKYIAKQNYPELYRELTEELTQSVENLRLALSKRSVVFSRSFDSVSLNKICRSINKRYLTAQKRLIELDIQDQLGLVDSNQAERAAELSRRTKEQLSRIVWQKAKLELSSQLKSIESALLNGHIEAITELSSQYEQNLAVYLDDFKGTQFAQEIKQRKQEFIDYRSSRMSLGSLQSSLNSKLVDLESLLFDLEDSRRAKLSRETLHPRLIKELGANGIDNPFTLPVIRNEKELSEIAAVVNGFMLEASSMLEDI